MAILFDEDEVARDFVLEYLAREPEFIDVAEFVAEVLDEHTDDDITAVYNSVQAYLDTVHQRFADSEN